MIKAQVQAEMDVIADKLNGCATYISGTDKYGIAGGHVVHDNVRYDLFLTARYTLGESHLYLSVERLTANGQTFNILPHSNKLGDDELSRYTITVNSAFSNRHHKQYDALQHIGRCISELFDGGLRRNRGRQQARDRLDAAYQESIESLANSVGVTPERAKDLLDFAQPFCKSRGKAYALAVALAEKFPMT